MNKKLFPALCASALLLTVCTACSGDSSSDSAADSSAAETTAATAETAAIITTAATEPIEFEEAVAAESGDAFLYLTDGSIYLYYDGTTDSFLTYDAGVAKIDGDGDYTVSVTCDTKAAKFDQTQDANGELVANGLKFAAVIVKDGTTLYPDMSIEVTEVRVDGKALDMTAKSYTSSDDGVEMRANVYNGWIPTTSTNLPEDAHNADGAITGEIGEYAPWIIDAAEIGDWSTFEVDFTVTGTGKAANDTEPAETTAAAE